MPAPKGNTNAAKPGTSRKYRVRGNEENHDDWALLNPYERGLAMTGYILWLDSLESDENSFLGWIERQIKGE